MRLRTVVEEVFENMLSITLILLVLRGSQTMAEYSKLEFTDCGSTVIAVNKVDVTPMPILRPSTGNLTLTMQIKRPISKFVRMKRKFK